MDFSTKVSAEPASASDGVPGFSLGNSVPTPPEPAPPKRSAAHTLWAVLSARIYEVFPLLCPICGASSLGLLMGGNRHSAAAVRSLAC